MALAPSEPLRASPSASMPSLLRALDETLTPASESHRLHRWALAAIVVYQLAVSLWLGWPRPDSSRWWDERFNVLNIESSLRAGRLSPANGYYGGVSYLPQTLVLATAEVLHGATGWPALDVLGPEGTLTAAGYHWIRGSQAVAGALALVLLYLLARRLAAAEVALAAAALTAVSPRMIHAGAIFKPDVELLAMTLLALLAGWHAASRPPHTGRYLLAGAAIGLAVGAKLNGVAVAVPLVVATALRGRELGRWPRLAAAGVASFASFWLFNPDVAQVLRSLTKNRAHYDRTSTGGPLDVLAETLRYPFEASFLGPLVGVLAVGGLTAVAVHAARRRGAAETRLGWWMLLAYPPAYYTVYAAASPRAKANHFLEVLPFAALFAAVALVAIVGTAARVATRREHPPGERRRWAPVATAVVVLAFLAPPAFGTLGEVYDLTVPTTWEAAQAWVERGLPDPRHGRRIVTLGGALRGGSPRAPAYDEVPISSTNAAASNAAGRFLADADGLIAATAAAEEEAGVAALAEWLGQPARRRTFHGGPFRARGEPVVAALRPFAFQPHPAAGRLAFTAGPGGTLVALLPAGIAPGTLVSLRVRLRLKAPAAGDLRLDAGGTAVGFVAGPASGGDTFLLSDRFAAPEAGGLTVSRRGGGLQRRANGELFVWEPR